MGVLLFAGCQIPAGAGGKNGDPLPESGGETINVVATNALLADLVGQVGGSRVEVTPLVPAGVDVHAFQLKPSNNLAVRQADLILSNGGQLDDFLNPALRNSARPEAKWIVASDGLEPSARLSSGDPHFWLDPYLAVEYVKQIRDGLVAVDPEHRSDYLANAEAYMGQLSALDREIEESLAQVAPEYQHLVTYHDAFGHLARRYGWKTTGLVPDDARDVAPGTLAELVRQIKRDGLPAVFAEPQFQQKVLTQIARDSGVRVGVIHSLPGPEAPTYLDMMRSNSESLTRELR